MQGVEKFTRYALFSFLPSGRSSFVEKYQEYHLQSTELSGSWEALPESPESPGRKFRAVDGVVKTVKVDESTTKEVDPLVGKTTLTFERRDTTSEVSDLRDDEVQHFADGFGVLWHSGWRNIKTTITQSRTADIEEAVGSERHLLSHRRGRRRSRRLWSGRLWRGRLLQQPARRAVRSGGRHVALQ